MTSATPSPDFRGSSVPVIDISPYFAGDAEAKRQVADQIDHACRAAPVMVLDMRRLRRASIWQ